MLKGQDVIDDIGHELEFEVPRYYEKYEMWFMKGKPDPANGNIHYYGKLGIYSLEEAKVKLLRLYHDLQQQKQMPPPRSDK